MRTQRLVRVVALIVFGATAIAACGQLLDGGMKRAKDCRHPGLCEVDVVVTNCVPTAQDIEIDKRGGAVNIRWNAPNDFVFTNSGIKFDASPVIDERPGMQEQGKRWMVVDRPNGNDVTSKYRIQVQSVSSPSTICTGPDPFVVNK
jgi:hypothetical protein